MKKIRDYFRLHIDIPTIVIILLIVAIVYRPFANFLFSRIGIASQIIKAPAWAKDIILNVISEFIAAFLLVVVGYIYIKYNSHPYFAGSFTAFAVTKIQGQPDDEEEWGDLRLTYNIFSKKIKGELKSKAGDARLKIDGEFDKERYLRGTYIDADKPSSLRLGAFIMLLNKNGDDYEGMYIALSPLTDSEQPEMAYAKWKRK